jgi:hypothetical protein
VEALGRLTRPAVIHALDPNPDALVRAKDLFRNSCSSSGARNEFVSCKEFTELPARLDLAIVATRAGDRLWALQQLLERRDVEYLILEKFLYSRREDYAEAAGLLESHSGRVWVNCPRRVYPGYAHLAQLLRNDGFVQVDVTCDALQAPLGTIGIHFLDLLDFLCAPSNAMPLISVDQLEVVDANRGMHDFAGCLNALYPRSGALRYRATTGSEAPMFVSITSDRRRFVIDERGQQMYASSPESEWSTRAEPFPVPLQSFLTDRIASELLSSGNCGLTPYSRSMILHLSLFDPIMDGYRRIMGDPLAVQVPFT